jgi:hypothetical protein
MSLGLVYLWASWRVEAASGLNCAHFGPARKYVGQLWNFLLINLAQWFCTEVFEVLFPPSLNICRI